MDKGKLKRKEVKFSKRYTKKYKIVQGKVIIWSNLLGAS